MLAAGGNAIDAAIAANLALGIVTPYCAGPGGDLFAIVWDGRAHGYLGAGRSAAGVTRDQLAAEYETMPFFGPHSVTVPGAVDGWFTLLERWGTRSFGELASVAIALADGGRSVRYSFNRKEEKDHGEGGSVIGAPLEGRVLIVDDVISAGTSVRQSVSLIRAARAVPCAVVIALDRMERGAGDLSATQEVEQHYRIPTISIATLDDLIAYLQTDTTMFSNLTAVDKYREKYGVAAHA